MKRAVPALLVALALATASVAMGGVPGPTDAADRSTTAAVDGPQNATSNASYGTAISTFMAETAANANGTVDQEMWEAAVTAPGSAAALTNERVQTLQQRLDRLVEQRQELLAAHENDAISEVAFRVRLSNLNARIEQLSAAVNATATIAKDHGVTPPDLQNLLSNVTEVAAGIRGNSTGLPVPFGNSTDGGGGPPDQGGADVPGNGQGPGETPGTPGTPGEVGNVTNTTVEVPGGGDDLPTSTANNTTGTTTGADVR